MPQMAPMSWLALFLMFSMMLLMVNPLNFFTTQQLLTTNSKTKTKTTTNWKW